MRDLGQLGQGQFFSLCVSKGIIANPATLDKRGWDYHLEIPINRTAGDASSMHRSAIECRVQVKSTEKNRLRWDVEYSNLHSLATCAIPAFYVLLEFEENADTPENIYIKYVDHDFIRKIMSKLRTRELEDKSFKLNSHTMSVTFDNNDMLKEPNSSYLKEKFLTAIGPNYDACVVEKRAFLERVGYEESAATVEFTVGGEENIQAIEDMLLGKTGTASLTNFNIWESRFGLKSLAKIISAEGGTIEIFRENPDWVGHLIVSPQRQAPNLKFLCSVYINKYSSSLKMHVKTDHFSLHLHENGMNTEIFFTENTELPLRTLLKNLKALSLIREEGCVIDLTGENSTKLYSVKTRPNLNTEGSRIKLLQYTQYILDKFDFIDDVNVTYSEIYDNRERIINLYTLFDGRFHPATLKVETSDYTTDEKGVCVFLHDVSIGEYRLLGYFSIEGTILEGGLIKGHPTLLESRVVPREQKCGLEASETIERLLQSYPDDVHTFSFGVNNSN
ncbi:hypothetical protein [Pseudomonas fluorescens]|uniref:hypothetical protein n=1 Tax=Pseudomonas fluorescens TaxID=294 RepID=UPI0012FE52EA|nr:hypothetical protein [Pseudomonas fluorescens]